MPPRRRKPERVLRWGFAPEPRRSERESAPSPRSTHRARWRDQRGLPEGPYERGPQGLHHHPPGGPWPTMGAPPGTGSSLVPADASGAPSEELRLRPLLGRPMRTATPTSGASSSAPSGSQENHSSLVLAPAPLPQR
eukprot:6877983-Alexandrium_andersonii.AAC.1